MQGTDTIGWKGRIAWFERDGRVVPAIVGLAVLLRLLFILGFPQRPFSDAQWYVLRAGEIANGLGYQEAGHPTAFWPVGWPAMLAGSIWLTGSVGVGQALVNLLAAGTISVLVWWFARTLGTGELGARIALFLYAVYPAAIVYAGVPASETASLAVAMTAFAMLVAGRQRWWMLLGAGLLFGAATLMRAQMLLFPAGAIVALMLVFPDIRWRSALRAAILVHLAMAALILPWSLRNERVLGSFVLVSTNGGVSLFTGANDRATGDWFAWEHTRLWDETGIPFGERIERQVELDHRFKALATDWIETHPARWSALGIKKMALLWRKDTDAFWALDGTYPDHSAVKALQAANQLFYLAMIALALWPLWVGVGAIFARDRTRAPLALLGCMPAFVTLTAFGFTGQIRYHYPAMPFVIAAAGWTLSQLLQLRRDRPRAINRRSEYDPRAA